jgi:hypothetical protein
MQDLPLLRRLSSLFEAHSRLQRPHELVHLLGQKCCLTRLQTACPIIVPLKTPGEIVPLFGKVTAPALSKERF